MARYIDYLNVRIDPIAKGALNKLGEAWGLQKEDGTVNNSEVVRRALIYSYLVYVEGVDPVRASYELEEYIQEKLIELGLIGEEKIRRRRRRRKSSTSFLYQYPRT